MEPLDDLPSGWQVWAAEDGGRIVLAYRPDVFNGEAFPPACLPTATVAPGASPDSHPERRANSGQWHVAFYLEPDVRVRAVEASFGDRDDALEAAVATAERFAAGEVDYRGAYQEPRTAYLDRLDELLCPGD